MSEYSTDVRPSPVMPRSALLLLPAMGVSPSYYERLVGQLEDRSFAVALADLAPQSTTRPGRSDHDGYAELVEQRIPAAFAEAQRSAQGRPVAIVGHSLGGQLGMIAAGRFFPETPVVLIASGTAHHRAFPTPRRQLYLVGSQAMGLLSSIIGHWPGDRLGFGGRQTSQTIHDWARSVRTGTYSSAGATFDYGEALRSYRGDVHVVHVADDRLAPARATRMLLAKTSCARRTETHYAAERGSTRPGSHFTWARDLPGVAGEIDHWLSRYLACPANDPNREPRDGPTI